MPQRDSTDPNFPPPPSEAGEKVELRVGYVPDNLKAKTAQTNGELAAAYQAGARAPKAGEDTQKIQPNVVIDETQENGIPADKINALVAKLRASEQRENTTAKLEVANEQKRSRWPLLLLLLLSVVVGAWLALRPSHPPTDLPSTSATNTATTAVTSAATIVSPPATSTASAEITSAPTESAATSSPPATTNTSAATPHVSAHSSVRAPPSSAPTTTSSPHPSGTVDPVFNSARTPGL